jgi:hypothetical protein
MGKRICVMIDDDTWRILGKIPARATSRRKRGRSGAVDPRGP